MKDQTEPTNQTSASSAGVIPLVSPEEFAENVRLGVERLSKHIVYSIYGLDVPNTMDPIIVESFTGAGKTHDLVEYAARAYKHRTTPLIIALREVKLAAEFICDFRDKVKAKSKVDFAHLGRHIELVFTVSDEHIDKIQAEIERDPDNERLPRVLNFYKNTTASTSLRGGRFKDIQRASLIITTHESAQNLGGVGLCEGTDMVWDEAVANAYHHHKMNDQQDYTEHVAKFLSVADSIDPAFVDAKRIGKRLHSGVWAISKDFRLTDSQIVEVNKKNVKKGFQNEKTDSCSTATRTSTTTATGSGSGAKPHKKTKRSVIKTAKHVVSGPKNDAGTLNHDNSSEKFTHFCTSYLDFSAFKANSVTILTACPEATSVAVLEKLSGKTFARYETEASKQRRALVRNAVAYMKSEYLTYSCSKASMSKADGKALIGIFKQVLPTLGGGYFAVCHSWLARVLNPMGIPSCKSGQVGSNTFQNCTFVAVLSLDFPTPEQKAIEECIFGEDYDIRAKFLMAGGCGQSVMRSGLRQRIPLPTTVFFTDARVREAFELFLS
jgi:hypothetical protein